RYRPLRAARARRDCQRARIGQARLQRAIVDAADVRGLPATGRGGPVSGLKILHVLDHSVPLQSGYAFRTLAILREQRRIGFETVHVTSTKHYGASADEEEVDGLTFFRTRPADSLLRRLPVVNQAMVSLDTATRVEEIARRLGVDVIHAHSPALNGLAALKAGRRLGLPVV